MIVEGYLEFYAHTSLMRFRTVVEWRRNRHLLYQDYENAVANLEALQGSNIRVDSIR